jgi:hypothetical protein
VCVCVPPLRLLPLSKVLVSSDTTAGLGGAGASITGDGGVATVGGIIAASTSASASSIAAKVQKADSVAQLFNQVEKDTAACANLNVQLVHKPSYKVNDDSLKALGKLMGQLGLQNRVAGSIREGIEEGSELKPAMGAKCCKAPLESLKLAAVMPRNDSDTKGDRPREVEQAGRHSGLCHRDPDATASYQPLRFGEVSLRLAFRSV